MKVSVVMPQLGLTMTEGAVSEWLKKPGHSVRRGEFLFIVSTDKADMEVESEAEGTLAEILVEPGRTVPVGTVIAHIENAGAEPAEASPSIDAAVSDASVPAAAAPAPVATKDTPASVRPRKETRAASPRARSLAQTLGVNLAAVKGTGLGGRITEKDVRRSTAAGGSRSLVPDDDRRRLIAERMVRSVETIPHFSVGAEVNAEHLLSLYAALKEPAEKATALKLTLTDLLLKALGRGLRETPQMNVAWDEAGCVPRDGIDLGLAIAGERGVVAPVIRNVDRLDLTTIAARRIELVENAGRGRLSLQDVEGGGGTLSNLGKYRVDQFQAIINPGQSFVLAVGRIQNRPWVRGEDYTVKPTAILNLSVDHRVADGAVAAEFLSKLADIVENPFRLLWNPPEPQ